ncbi:hypothetical protein [Ornithinimicrobium flavum]|uniref:hypothetical protein n=1 Tax=Ornithinimicrobium flavum TaxID=1288636 RepID=UPI00106F6A69|nr:hypothetical protein [Ornithinimicrobium flavum]
MSQPPAPGPMSPDPGLGTPGMTPLGGRGADLWQQARSRCTACGSEGLLHEGYLADTGESAKGYVRWVGAPRDTSLFGSFSSMGADKFLVRAFRCRECRHLELFAEERD